MMAILSFSSLSALDKLKDKAKGQSNLNQSSSSRSIPSSRAISSPVAGSKEVLTTIENQLTAIENKDYKTAYENYTTYQFQSKTSLEEFSFFVTSYPPFIANKNALFGNIESKNGVTSIQGTLTGTDGKTVQLEYFLAKEGSLWKVMGIKIIKPEPMSNLSQTLLRG